ncbi:HAD-IIIC family phosphatase [Paenibacillus sp. TRM 82003]|uniref:HAD-IIIC family phosphatase n=1 Tax=Kineococcus sp. TRM81007 TaxID=2925831 RepID=UPI001F55B17D|nr:HAD-IIIC family phosphatase [Kineococcus sp. TRM81007]MCI2239148.1 HAD-IIIC family phosphatase [Kineococcus sp. TRM81007]MCI3924827.1 HAD-IIIC family phosphatase [Paenibacillus sp. TRM 82003]
MQHVEAADEQAGRSQDPVARALATVSGEQVPTQRACLDLARALSGAGDAGRAVRWAFASIDAGEDFAGWLAASRLWQRHRDDVPRPARRARVAVLGSYTTTQLTGLLPLACARAGVDVEVYECGYGLYRQELLDPSSGLHAFDPDVVVLAVDAAEVDLPQLADDPEAAVEAELGRWTSLWDLARERFGARVVQHGVVVPPDEPLGHLAARVPGSRSALLRRLQERMGEVAASEAGRGVALVDCERLASDVGKRVWSDPRYVHAAKQAVSLACVPLLARHTAAVLAAQLGASRKCLVLDLDNTLWGGVLGEVGVHGIALGAGAAGEAFSAFQRHVLALKDKGVVLAVCSKNDEHLVREAFEQNPEMLLSLDDVAVLRASWQDKPTAVRGIAAALGIGEDALVFVDDNPAEREAVRELAPAVDVVPLPAEPAGYVAALSRYPFFETDALTAEDAARTAQYRARAQVAEQRESAGSLEDFLRGLDMRAEVAPLGPENVARVAQLLGKTNQFNLTTRRHSLADVESFAADPAWHAQVVRLRDRFADHGVVGVLLARRAGAVLEVDSWLMSCRVIGRTLEDEMFGVLVRQARAAGCTRLRGTYVPTAKNGQVAGLYERLGFTRDESADGAAGEGATGWVLEVPEEAATPGLVAVQVDVAAGTGPRGARGLQQDGDEVPAQRRQEQEVSR